MTQAGEIDGLIPITLRINLNCDGAIPYWKMPLLRLWKAKVENNREPLLLCIPSPWASARWHHRTQMAFDQKGELQAKRCLDNQTPVKGKKVETGASFWVAQKTA